MELSKNLLLFLGVALLIAAIQPVRRLIGDLPHGKSRSLWKLLLALICLFLGGYAGYAIFFWGTAEVAIDLIVPAVFFFGACFVVLVCHLSFRTSKELKRIYILEYESTTDSLTKIYNRRQFDRRLREEFSVAKRNKQPLSLLMIDIDFFKEVNDQLGHQGGDMVLRRLAEIMTSCVREGDIVCRYGGEEFSVILPQTNGDCAVVLAERLREQIAGTELLSENMSPSKKIIQVTVSVGVATLSDSIASIDALVNDADKALYAAKQGGRNRVIDYGQLAEPL
ncbi:MAG TPA: GGDEF domain-containing protein [Wenzhouxiangella sp.]|nr:GGDEF domain-containing protein [Wenzhouxiangella sp.]